MDEAKPVKKKLPFTRFYKILFFLFLAPIAVVFLKAFIFSVFNKSSANPIAIDDIFILTSGASIILLVILFILDKFISRYGWRILTPFAIAYIALFIYGRFAIIPRNEALTLVKEAESSLGKLSSINNTPEFINEEKKAVDLYEKASKVNLKQYGFLGYDSSLDGFIKENYQFSKDILALDEGINSGKIILSNEEYETTINTLRSRRKAIMDMYAFYDRTHSWMYLIFLK